jgi:hypothetical protein
MARQYREEEGKEAPVDEFVELDLDKTLTWTGNSVIVQRGAVFRMPLLVPQPSVLAIQFEIEGGYDIEFSLTFKEDHEEESVVMVHTSARNSLHHIQSLQTHPDAGRGVPVVPLAGLSVHKRHPASQATSAVADPNACLYQTGSHAPSAGCARSRDRSRGSARHRHHRGVRDHLVQRARESAHLVACRAASSPKPVALCPFWVQHWPELRCPERCLSAQ